MGRTRPRREPGAGGGGPRPWLGRHQFPQYKFSHTSCTTLLPHNPLFVLLVPPSDACLFLSRREAAEQLDAQVRQHISHLLEIRNHTLLATLEPPPPLPPAVPELIPRSLPTSLMVSTNGQRRRQQQQQQQQGGGDADLDLRRESGTLEGSFLFLTPHPTVDADAGRDTDWAPFAVGAGGAHAAAAASFDPSSGRDSGIVPDPSAVHDPASGRSRLLTAMQLARRSTAALKAQAAGTGGAEGAGGAAALAAEDLGGGDDDEAAWGLYTAGRASMAGATLGSAFTTQQRLSSLSSLPPGSGLSSLSSAGSDGAFMTVEGTEEEEGMMAAQQGGGGGSETPWGYPARRRQEGSGISDGGSVNGGGKGGRGGRGGGRGGGSMVAFENPLFAPVPEGTGEDVDDVDVGGV